ncbi:MAG TPA: sugar MFS transporter [Gemmatirosa sp.]
MPPLSALLRMALAAAPPVTRADATPAPTAAASRLALPTVTALFFAWGFLTSLNDILVPHLRGVFALSYAQAALVQFTFFGAYFVTALPWGRVVTRVGYQRGIVLGLAVAGVGALLFYPAAGLLSYGLFLTALFVLASGITLLQVAANPYVAVLGPPEAASSRLALTQAFNSLGTTLAPLVGGLLIFTAALGTAATYAQRLATARTVQGPYVGLAVALFALAGVMAAARLPRLAIENDDPASDAGAAGSVWRVRHLVLGAVGIFVYVGAEVCIGSFLINFLGEARIAGYPAAQAAHYVAYYWGGAMVGRFIGSALLQRFSPRWLLAVFAAVAGALTLTAVLATGHVAMWALLSVGLFNSIMFPTIFALAIEGLGHRTGQGSSVLVTAIVGGALLPLAYGALADRIGLQPAFLLPALCYIYIVYYGLRGSRHALAAA